MSQSQRHARAPLRVSAALARSRHEIAALAPYRLDLTVSVLRRLSTNVVDIFTPEGRYVRALAGTRGPVLVRVHQTRPDALVVVLEGDVREPGERARLLGLVRRTLGTHRDLAHFNRTAATIPWLRALARRVRGVKPPRYPTIWEAFVNSVVFQQVSLKAASTITRRLIMSLGTALEDEGTPLYLFPSAARVLHARDSALRATGLSANKVATLRRAGEALLSGALSETMLEERPSADAAALLQQIKGIGPWTAAVILLRGFGRLDVFPMHDTSIAHNITLVAGTAPLDIKRVLAALSPQQGMLYYLLLLARLEARGEAGRASIPAR